MSQGNGQLTTEEKRTRLQLFARRHQRKPYRYGARPSDAPKWFDCSSFIQYLFRRVGLKLPRRSYEQALQGTVIGEPTETTLRVGDLLFFTGSEGRYGPDFPNGVGHVAMYLGQGKIAHATQTKADGPNGGAVRIASLSHRLKRGDFVIARRIL